MNHDSRIGMDFHPDFLHYVYQVSENCSNDIFILCSVKWENRNKWSYRAISRLQSIGWFATMVEYRKLHILYVTRTADRLRWANVYVALASENDIYTANLYDANGLGYSGPGWYGRVAYGKETMVLFDDDSTMSDIDCYARFAAKPQRPVRGPLKARKATRLLLPTPQCTYCESAAERSSRVAAEQSSRAAAAALAERSRAQQSSSRVEVEYDADREHRASRWYKLHPQVIPTI